MAPSARHIAAPVLATISCHYCRRMDIPCVLPVGSRTCVNCSRLRRHCRVSRDDNTAVTRRFRTRMSALRAALTGVLSILDSVDLCSTDIAG